jgi:tetratricopeptide (TPR) repeat protein
VQCAIQHGGLNLEVIWHKEMIADNHPIQIEMEPPRLMTLGQELDLAQSAWTRSPGVLNRHRLAMLVFRHDDFDRVIDLLGNIPDLSSGEDALLVQSYLAKETEIDNRRAYDIAGKAVEVAKDPAWQSALLSDQAKAASRLGLTGEARALLERALAMNPGNKDACKRLAALDLLERRADQLVDWCAELRAMGVGHSRLHAAKVMGQAARGQYAQAQAANGLDLLCHSGQIAAPSGWQDVSAFNAALAEELLTHKGLRFEKYGTASNLSWRIDSLVRPDAPLISLLLNQIADQLSERIRILGEHDHPWVSDGPKQALLRAWCVITDGDGYEGWHVHQFGWLSGVYYVQVPDGIRTGSGVEGCIAFGLPEEQVGTASAAAFGVTTIRPEPGMMLTFPSHVYHRTFAHGALGKRICVAFDLQPT